MNNKYKIGIIGAGVMGSTIVKCLLKNKVFLHTQIFVSDSDRKKLSYLRNKYKIQTINRNDDLVKNCHVVILAVKPQQFHEVTQSIKKQITVNKLFISIIAGINIKTLVKYLGHRNVIRTMPNLAARIQKSVTVWYAPKYITDKFKKILRKILRSFGEEIEVRNEKEIDAATAISGSGPAYIFYLMEILERSGLLLNFKRLDIKKLVSLTFEGALKLYDKTQESPSSLREKVTSKGGTTEAAFKILKSKKVDKIWIRAVEAAYKRALKLQKIYE